MTRTSTSANASIIETNTNLKFAAELENYEVYVTPLCGPIMFQKEEVRETDEDCGDASIKK
jgi:hypothetical protein